MPFIFKQIGSSSGSSGPPVIAGFLTASLLLSAATLTGGLRLASATGSVPQALTMAVETFVTGTANGRHGLAFDPDGNHFWLADSSAHSLKRYLLSNGVIDLVVTGSTTDPTRNVLSAGPSTLKLCYGNRLWFVTENTHMVGFIDVSTSTPKCEIFSGSGLPSNTVDVCEHLPGRILVRAGSATAASTYQEFAYSGTGSANTVAYTGQSIIEATTFWTAIPDMSGNVYTTNSTTVIKRSSTTLTASATFTPIGGNVTQLPGYGTVRREMVYYPNAAKLLVKGSSENEWEQFSVAGMTLDGRCYPDSEWGNPMSAIAASYERNPISFSPDGTKQVHLTFESDASATTFNNVRTLTLGIQRARWSFVPGVAVHVKSINLSGHFANQVGSVSNMPNNAWLNSEYDLRKTKFFYSLDGGNTRTEFRPSEFVNVAVSAVQTLTVDVDMQKTPMNNYGVNPYVGDKTVAGLAGFLMYLAD